MYATVVTVDITASQFEASRKMLKEEVVPRISKAPGFVKGFWSVRGATPPPGVKLNNVEVREVIADA